MNRGNIINKFIQKYKYETYLEIGVDGGWLFNSIGIKNKESVDPALGQYSHANPTHKMTSDEYFENCCKVKYDIIFIDGLHESHQVDKDIKNSLKCLNDGGRVLLHDCSPPNEKAQMVPRPGPGVWNGDVWKSLVKFNIENHDEYNVYVVDTDHGVGVIEKGKGVCNIEMPEELDYKWLSKNRKDALNLISVKEFNSKF